MSTTVNNLDPTRQHILSFAYYPQRALLFVGQTCTFQALVNGVTLFSDVQTNHAVTAGTPFAWQEINVPASISTTSAVIAFRNTCERRTGAYNNVAYLDDVGLLEFV